MSLESLSTNVTVTKNSRNYVQSIHNTPNTNFKILVHDDANERISEHSKQIAYSHGPP